MTGEPLLKVANLTTWFRIRQNIFNWRKHYVKAVTGVSFEIKPGETLGLVGESGSGKTTIGRTLMGLTPATSGQAVLHGQDILASKALKQKPLRKLLQMVFQDPYSSLNPRMTVMDIITEGLTEFKLITKDEKVARAQELMHSVGLPADVVWRYPHEFSGGQRQRINIARAISLKPNLIICDEPVSALDVSVQAQVLNLLQDLKQEFGLAYLFISHDLGVVSHMSDRVMVMQAGRIVESGPTAKVLGNPEHPYTQKLIAAVPGF